MKRRGEIVPGRIGFLDQLDLPASLPTLQFLFACNGDPDVCELLEIDQPVNAVFACKPPSQS
jgi:hypothetical protein